MPTIQPPKLQNKIDRGRSSRAALFLIRQGDQHDASLSPAPKEISKTARFRDAKTGKVNAVQADQRRTVAAVVGIDRQQKTCKARTTGGKDMMNITSKTDAGEYLAWLQEEIAAKPRNFSDDDLICMLADLKRQVVGEAPAELTARIDATLQQLEGEEKSKNHPARN
jgi:hypothetical protein